MKSSHEKVVAFIVARLSSSRFPAKQLRKIGKHPLLFWTLHNLKKSTEIDEIVVATTSEAASQPLARFCSDNNVECFSYDGDINAVTTRLCEAAKTYQADISILISGDCPLTDGEAIDQLINMLRSDEKLDCISTPPRSQEIHCLLQGVMACRTRAWLLAESLSTTPELKEHHFPVMYQQRERFTARDIFLDMPVYSHFHRLSIDTFADYRFFTEVYKHLQQLNQEFNLVNVVSLIDRFPELRQINQHVYQRKVIEIIPDIFFVEFGGLKATSIDRQAPESHLMLALYLTEQKGWPVTFITNDRKRQEELAHYGINCLSASLDQEILHTILARSTSPCILIENRIFDNVIEVSTAALLNSCICLGPGKTSEIGTSNFLHSADFYNSIDENQTLFTRIASFIQSRLN